MSSYSLKNLLKSTGRNTRYFFYTTLWLMRNVRSENFKNYIPHNFSGKKLMILANGPSLKKTIETLYIDTEEYDVRVVNDFCRHRIFFSLKPKSYVLADPLFFNDTPRAKEVMELLNNVSWPMALYIPYACRKKFNGKITNSNIKIILYHSLQYNGWKKIRNFLYRKGLSMPRPQNVLIPSIFIGINQGYKEIDLYGVEHSWTNEIRVDDKNQVCLVDSHFYDNSKPELKPWHKGSGEPVYKMHEILRDLAWMFDGYHQLQEYAESSDCKIVNCTPDSFIDAFKRGGK